MFKSIIQTVAARYLAAFLNLILIFINSRTLGREAMGVIGVVYAATSLAVIVNSILCGNTIVYFMNRHGMRSVFAPAYVWAVIGSAAACAAMYFCGALPEGYEATVMALATLTSLTTANTLMLLGKDKVKSFNATFLLQSMSMFALLAGIYFVAGYKSINGYMTGVLASYAIAFIYSLILLAPHLSNDKPASWGVMKAMVVYGMWSAADNLAEGLTARINYFLIRHTGGYAQVGLLDAGTRLSESVWHISNSVSYLEYNSVSKTDDLETQRRVTLRLFKLTACALVAVMAVAVCAPEKVFTEWLLTAEFAGIRGVIICLAPGIVASGANKIISHYFIGSGRVRYSAYCSVVGLAALLAAGSALMPTLGIRGAALSASAAYICMLTFSIVVFKKQTNASVREFIPSKDDWHEFVFKIKNSELKIKR